jgi:NPCBM-associated, NEW3 domain of alpha-galactosidase
LPLGAILLVLGLSLVVIARPACAHESAGAPTVAEPGAVDGDPDGDDVLSVLTRGLADPQRDVEERLRIAAARQQWLADLMERRPGDVLRRAMSPAARDALPAALQALVEEEESHEGQLEVFHADGPQGGAYHYALREASGRRLALRFDGGGPALLTGTSVSVNGVRVQEALALGGTGSVTVLGPAVLPSTFGEHKVLVILLRFLDTPATTLSPSAASVQSLMFGTTGSTVNNFYRENSYQQTWLTGTVVGPFTIPLSSAGCDTDRIAMLAQQALSGVAGVVLGQYQHIVYAFPSSGCVWWGLGSIGGIPGQVWVSGALQPMVGAHELGHNFGLYHSHALECGTVTMGGSCTSINYGDNFDVMGNGAGPTHFNAVQKDLLGWLDYGASPPITNVVASATYTVDALEPAGAGAKALRIKTALGDWLYVEYRRPVGFDSYLSSNANVMGGVLIHYFDGDLNGVYLLDMTPATSSWSDPALAVGATFEDTAGQVRITPTGINNTRATVTVTVGGPACVPAAPTVTITPAQQQAAPGATAMYTVSVANNGTGCGAATFSLQASLPPGWAAALGAPALVIGEGAAASTTLQVTSSAAAPPGTYNLSLSTAESGLAGSSGASYTVTGPVGPGGGGGSFTDAFDRPDDPTGLGNGWSAASGGFQIVSGEARNQVAKVFHMAVRPELVGATQTVAAAFASTSNNVSPRFGVVLRYRDVRNHYLCYRQVGGTSVLRIAKVVNGVETVLKSVAVPNPVQGARFTLSCQVSGGALTLQLDGATKATASDASPLAAGSAGFAMGGSTGGGASHRADDFSAVVQ